MRNWQQWIIENLGKESMYDRAKAMFVKVTGEAILSAAIAATLVTPFFLAAVYLKPKVIAADWVGFSVVTGVTWLGLVAAGSVIAYKGDVACTFGPD